MQFRDYTTFSNSTIGPMSVDVIVSSDKSIKENVFIQLITGRFGGALCCQDSERAGRLEAADRVPPRGFCYEGLQVRQTKNVFESVLNLFYGDIIMHEIVFFRETNFKNNSN